MKKTKLKVSGMSCEHCVKQVSTALTEIAGVRRAKVNLRKGEAVVHFDGALVDTPQLTAAVIEAGFEVLSAG